MADLQRGLPVAMDLDRVCSENLPVSARYDSCVRALAVGELEQPGHLSDGAIRGASGQSIVEQRGVVRAADALDPDIAVVGVALLQSRGDEGAKGALDDRIVLVLLRGVGSGRQNRSTYQVALLFRAASKDEDCLWALCRVAVDEVIPCDRRVR